MAVIIVNNMHRQKNLRSNKMRRHPLQDASSKGNSAPLPLSDLKPGPSPLPIQDVSTKIYNPPAKGMPLGRAPRTYQTSAQPPGNAVNTTHLSASLPPPLLPVSAQHQIKTRIGPWQLGAEIGQGGTSRVRKAKHAGTGQLAVAKIVAKSTAERVRARSLANLLRRVEKGSGLGIAADYAMPLGLEREVVIMRLLRHPNIVELYDVWENRNEVYLIMEYVEGGELLDYVVEKRVLPERDAVYLFRQIVGALLYCHRMQIIHRDLKPENILLDLRTFTVKLIDFGLAALQPQGGFLSTPCGSPHYAAPELLTRRLYDGSKVDVWSSAVVLFVMLTGSPPFNFPLDAPEAEKLKHLYAAIFRAQYKVPRGMCKEAQDLFKKAFVPSPENRISIEELWNHPFLRKYDAEFVCLGLSTTDSLVGPRPDFGDLGPLAPSKIDPEILRNLQTLWHEVPEDKIVRNLCSADPNQQKFFYAGLLKYREEHIENLEYSPGLPASCSSSNYSRTRPKVLKPPPPRPEPRAHHRSSSQYSVLNDEHLYSRHSFLDVPPSEESYDPFRASREQHVPKKSRARGSVRGDPPGRRQSNGSSVYSGRTLSVRVSKQSATSMRSRSRSLSRISVASLSTGRTGQPTIRPVSRHRRAVNFSHVRRGSSSIASSIRRSVDGTSKTPERHRLRPAPSTPRSELTASPPLQPQHVVRSAKEATRVPPTPRTRRLNDIEQEARKVSTELEKACMEAFYRTSVPSSPSSSPHSAVSSNPSTGISTLHNPRRPTKVIDRRSLNRPLPPVPPTEQTTTSIETPRTYTTRELHEMRQRLAVKYAKDGATNNKIFNDVLLQLDNVITTGAAAYSGDARRSSSVPMGLLHHAAEETNHLQAIPEEGRFTDSDELTLDHSESKIKWKRAVTDPSPRRPVTERGRMEPTIRIVEPSSPLASSPKSPSPCLPLKIRKQDGVMPPTSDMNDFEHTGTPPTILNSEGVTDSPDGTPNNKLNTRKSWWRRASSRTQDSKLTPRSVTSPTSSWEELDDRVTRRDEQMASPSARSKRRVGFGLHPINETNIENASINESQNPPKRNVTGVPGDKEQKGKGLLDIFKKKKKLKVQYQMTVNSEDQMNQIINDASGTGSSTPDTWNFFSRFLRIKPESRCIPLKITRAEARYDLKHIERNLRLGLKDVALDPNNINAIYARVDHVNAWNIKPCTFVVEIFAILNHGLEAELCVVRFTQLSGAASSLRRIASTSEDYFRSHDKLQDDKNAAKAMIGALKVANNRSNFFNSGGEGASPNPKQQAA